MITNTHRRLTAGPPEDNPVAIAAAIHSDAMVHWERIEAGMSHPLDTRTALSILLYHALDELASYWPEPTARDVEFDAALFALRCELLPQLRGDAKPVEVLRHALAEIALLRERVAQPAQPRYDWSPPSGPSSGITITTPTLTYQGNDAAGNPILAIPAGDADDDPVGVAVAEMEPDEEEVAATPGNFPVLTWSWRSPIWARVPPDVLETIRELEMKTLSWRQVGRQRRLQIIQHVIANLPAQRQSDYDVLKPAWLPGATGINTTFRVKWADLVAAGSPWA